MTITYSQLGKMGRLGNQLFQIATTISAAIKNNTDYLFPNWEHEKHFNLHNCFSNNLPIYNRYQEPYFHYSPIPNNQNMDLLGYLQSYKYFEDYKNLIIDKLTPIHHFDQEIGLCSIHIRRGDYIHQPHNHPTQSMEYYSKAMELSGCNKFLIFSDDINWCKKNFIGNQFNFIEGNHQTVDLAMMCKKCEHNIICNSSFSWWAAYLNSNPNKIVIYPNKWFGTALSHNVNDLCPPEWTKI